MTGYLLDTHCWLWMQVTPERFSANVRAILLDLSNDLYLSAASSWEIAIKHALGKLDLPESPAHYVPKRLASGGVRALPVEHAHALAVADLPPHHRDPFDRLLVAQARVEGLPLISADQRLARYDIEVLPAT